MSRPDRAAGVAWRSFLAGSSPGIICVGIVLAGRETRTMPVAVHTKLISFDQLSWAARAAAADRHLAGAAIDRVAQAPDSWHGLTAARSGRLEFSVARLSEAHIRDGAAANCGVPDELRCIRTTKTTKANRGPARLRANPQAHPTCAIRRFISGI